MVFIRAANSLTQDAIEVTANIRFHIAEVNKATFRDEIDDATLFRYLHGHQEVLGCLGGEEQEDSLFREDRVRRIAIDFYDAPLVEMTWEIGMQLEARYVKFGGR
jgi:hypothetical protein